MRAREYIENNRGTLVYADEVEAAVRVLMPLRLDFNKTREYCHRYLSADTRVGEYLYHKGLYEKGSCWETVVPQLETYDGELDAEISPQVRKELFEAIKDDETFGYLYFFLGTERNASSNNCIPLDCIPNAKRIEDAIKTTRDNYPQINADAYLSDDFNYKWYNRLVGIGAIDDDENVCLDYFNKAYKVYDDLRVLSHSVLNVKKYIDELVSTDESIATNLLGYVAESIGTFAKEDIQLNHLKNEIAKKIDLTKFSTEHSPKPASKIVLSKDRGVKIDFIRVINALCELKFFEKEAGGKATKKDVFAALGQTVGTDLSDYDKHLSRQNTDSTKLASQLEIFTKMENVTTGLYNKKMKGK